MSQKKITHATFNIRNIEKINENFEELYSREGGGGGDVGEITTDQVNTNPDVMFRDSKGRFKSTDTVPDLKNQLEVNRWFIEQIEINAESIDTIGSVGYDDTQIKEDLTTETKVRIDGDADLKRQIDAIDVPDLNGYATEEYVDNGDRTLQAEVEELALALNTLLVQREHGKWKYVGYSGDTIPRNAGEFTLLVDDIESSNENMITLNTTDLEGTVHGFADVEVGDYIEVVDRDAPEAYALFVVAKAPEGTGIVNVEVTLKEKGLNIWVGETCEIRFFAINEQQLDLADLDKRYVNKSGSIMTGTLTIDNAELKIKDEDGVSFFRVRPDSDSAILKGSFEAESLKSDVIEQKTSSGVIYSGSMNNANNLATVGYVDNAVKGGGSITQTILSRGAWGRSVDELTADKFIGFDYNGNTRNNLDAYTMGIAIAERFGNEDTAGLEWKEGGYVDVYDGVGNLIFCEEVHRVEYDKNNYLRIYWDYMPTMYIGQNRSYGDPLMLKLTGLTGNGRQGKGRNSPIPPPLDDPYIGE